jgi:hypothetical protein
MFPTSGKVVKVAPTVNTAYTVTARFASTECQRTATRTVTVQAKPTFTTKFTHPTTCGGTNGSITLSGLAPSVAYTLNYSRNQVAIAPVVRTSNTSGIIVISGLSAGTYNNINLTLNGCSSNSQGPIILNNPNPPVLTVPGDLTRCAGTPTNTITFSATPTSAFNWINNNSSIGLATSGTTSSISSFNAVNNGTTVQTATISVTATANGCKSETKTMRIIVNPLPQITVTSTPVCGRDSATLSVSGVADSYSWSPTTAMFPTSGKVVKVAPTINTTYTVTARFASTQCQRTATRTVIVQAKPAKPTITESNGNLVSSSTSANQWLTNGTNIVGATNQIYTPVSNGLYSVQVTSNGCSNVSDPLNYNKFKMIQKNSLLKEESLEIYPNPISGNFIVEYNLIDDVKEINLKVINSAGALIKEFKNIQSREQLSASELPKGNLIFLFETPDTKRQLLYKIVNLTE